MQNCVNINCNIGTETLWLLLGHICSYYFVSLDNNRVINSTEQCIGLVWLRIKSICVISRNKVNETCGLIQVRDILTTCVTVTYSRKTPFSFFFSLTSYTGSL
jgi:hypothetical protein